MTIPTFQFIMWTLAVAVGFYCAGRLYGAIQLVQRTEKIFRDGYNLGQLHALQGVSADIDKIQKPADDVARSLPDNRGCPLCHDDLRDDSHFCRFHKPNKG